MSKRREVVIEIAPEDNLFRKISLIKELIIKGLKGGTVAVILTRRRRTLDQNAKMWPLLEDVARQVQLCVNGEMVWADKEDWKDVITAAYRRESKMAMGIDGGVVMLGMRTRNMKVDEMSELIELIYAYGSQQGVTWSEKALEHWARFGKGESDAGREAEDKSAG